MFPHCRRDGQHSGCSRLDSSSTRDARAAGVWNNGHRGQGKAGPGVTRLQLRVVVWK